jgi:transposase
MVSLGSLKISFLFVATVLIFFTAGLLFLVFRARRLLVRQMVQTKNKIGVLLMEAGVSYNKQRLHKAGYFRELLATNPDIVRSLERDSLLMDRVERLMTIPAVGPITALTWALEVGDAKRFSSIKKAISLLRAVWGGEEFR